jgi:hypothetical protein
MEKEFVAYKLAVKLKELGFNDPCFNLYDFRTKELMYKIPNIGEVVMFKYDNHNKTNHISVPTFSQAFRWFESKGYRNYVASNQFGGKVNYWFAITPPEELTYSDVEGRSTKEEAELACLEKLIEIVESKSE